MTFSYLHCKKISKYNYTSVFGLCDLDVRVGLSYDDAIKDEL